MNLGKTNKIKISKNQPKRPGYTKRAKKEFFFFNISFSGGKSTDCIYAQARTD